MSEDDRPKGPLSIVDGKLARTSVSQMQKADGCLRQWRLNKVEGLPDKPPGAGQRRGTAGHRRIERFLGGEGKQVLDHLELVGVQKGLIPEPGSDLFVEHPFHVEGARPVLHALDIPLTGFIDLVNPRGDVISVVDWKFKKPWNGKLGFDAADLEDPSHEAGIQMLGYGAWVNRMFVHEEHVRLSHVTFQTEGRADVREAAVTLSLDTVIERWDIISQRIIPRMKAAVLAPHALDVEPNESLCEKYGGCPYKSTCFDRMARIRQMFKQQAPTTGETLMGMLSSMVSTPAAPAAPVTRKVPIEDVPFTVAQAIQGNAYVVNGVNAKFLCNTDMGGTTFASFMPLAGGAPILVTLGTVFTALPTPALPFADRDPIVIPPDAPKSDPLLAAKPAPGTLPPAAAETPAPDAPAAPAEKKPRAKKAPAHEVVLFTSPTVATVETSTLYFGCAPVGVATSTLHAYVEELDKSLQKQAQIDLVDIRTAGDNVFGFGKWKGFMAKAALESMPAAGHYVVTPGDERIDCVANALSSVCRVVMAGGR